MSKDKDKGIAKEKVEDHSFTLKTMQQQFRWMNLMLGEIRYKLERQDVEMLTYRWGGNQ